jgi:hypothetical protein
MDTFVTALRQLQRTPARSEGGWYSALGTNGPVHDGQQNALTTGEGQPCRDGSENHCRTHVDVKVDVKVEDSVADERMQVESSQQCNH